MASDAILSATFAESGDRVASEGSTGSMTASRLVDGNVHFHRCLTWKAFLASASGNFAAARCEGQVPRDGWGCLMLTETAGVGSCQALLNGPGLVRSIGR